MSEPIYSTYDKPGLVKTIAILTLVNGIVNIFWGLLATAAVVPTVILACLAVFTILPTILGVFEIVYAAKLLAEPAQPVQPSQPIAILEILCILTGNVFSMIVGILSLVFYNDPVVKEYFARLNGMPIPTAPTPPTVPVPPASPTESAPTPTETDSAAPKAPAAPKPKKPGSRKVAKTADKSRARKQPAKKAAKKSSKPKQARKSGSSSS